MYMCVCVCVCEGREKGGRGGEWCWVGRWVGGLVSMCWCVCVVLCCVVCFVCLVCLVFLVCVVVSLKIKWSSTASSGKANDWRNRARVVLDLFSNLEWVRTKGFFL